MPSMMAAWWRVGLARLMPASEREAWLKRRFPAGPPRPEWWLSLARSAEQEASEPLYGGRSASWRIFELAGWVLDTAWARRVDRTRVAYWDLRIARVAVRLGKPLKELPQPLTSDGAARRAAQALNAGGKDAVALLVPLLAEMQDAIVDPSLAALVRGWANTALRVDGG